MSNISPVKGIEESDLDEESEVIKKLQKLGYGDVNGNQAYIEISAIFLALDDDSRCSCGHPQFGEFCHFTLGASFTSFFVCRQCAEKLGAVVSERAFRSLRTVSRNLKAVVDPEIIEISSKHHCISDWERSFYQDTSEKRYMTEKQWKKRMSINEKLVHNAYWGKPPLIEAK